MTDVARNGARTPAAAVPGEPLALRWRYVAASLLFFIAYRLLGLRRRVVRRNLERSFPGHDARRRAALAREFVTRQSQVFAELDYARLITAEELRRHVILRDPAQMLASSGDASGRRIVFVGGHQCNFEWLLLRLSLEFGPGLVALYKPMRSARVERYFINVRTRFGARLLAAKTVTRELGQLRAARALGLIADQMPRTSPDRHWTTFLHQHTAFFKGPERLARALRASVVYVSMRRLRRGCYEIELQPLAGAGEKLPDGEVTDRYARVLERDIEADPAGWWWSHKRWKALRGERDAPAPVTNGPAGA